MQNTWVKFYRSILEHELLANDNASLIVFMKLLLKVDRKTGRYITGRFKLSELVNLPPTTAWDALKRLQKHKMVVIKSDNKKSLITICNWHKYQSTADTLPVIKPSSNRHQTVTKQEERSKNKEIGEPEFKTYFKEKKVKGSISPAMRGQVAKVLKLFEESRAGVYNNTLHTQPLAELISKHGFDLVYEKAEYALSLPKSDFNPWFDKPIDLADHFDWLVNPPLIGEAGERQKLINDMREGGFSDKTINAALTQHGYKELDK